MPGKIFVNYRREDGAATAARIRDRLAHAFGKSNVFMDVDNLLAGQRFDRELEKALATCDVFIAVIGQRWVELLSARKAADERDYVHEEIAAALKRGIVVIPVLIEGARLPRPAELPEDLREMVLHQKHDVAHEYFGRDIETLITAIKAGHKAVRADRSGMARFMAWRWIGAGAAAVVGLAGGAIYQLGTPVPMPSTATRIPLAGPNVSEDARTGAARVAQEATRLEELAAQAAARKLQADANIEAEAQRHAALVAQAKQDADTKQKAEADAAARQKAAAEEERARAANEVRERAEADAARQREMAEAARRREEADRQRQAALRAEEDRQRTQVEAARQAELAALAERELATRQKMAAEVAAKAKAEDEARRSAAAAEANRGPDQVQALASKRESPPSRSEDPRGLIGTWKCRSTGTQKYGDNPAMKANDSGTLVISKFDGKAYWGSSTTVGAGRTTRNRSKWWFEGDQLHSLIYWHSDQAAKPYVKQVLNRTFPVTFNGTRMTKTGTINATILGKSFSDRFSSTCTK